MSGTNDSMSDTLGEVFGTTKVASATSEDLEKQASIEFFNGLCQEQGIDITQLKDEQAEELWKVAMEMKAAEFPPNFAKGKGEEKGEKKEEKEGDKEKAKEKEAAASKLAAAESEFLQKRAAAEKVAEAEAMGKIMAHSFVSELNKIAEKNGEPPPFGKKDEDGKDGKDKKDEGKKEASAADKAAALITAFETAKTAGAGAPSGSTTPAFDEQAAYRAIELLKEAGVDPRLAFDKVNAVHVLGLGESTKIASAPDLQTGLHVRALEICEAAGFPVTWPST